MVCQLGEVHTSVDMISCCGKMYVRRLWFLVILVVIWCATLVSSYLVCVPGAMYIRTYIHSGHVTLDFRSYTAITMQYLCMWVCPSTVVFSGLCPSRARRNGTSQCCIQSLRMRSETHLPIHTYVLSMHSDTVWQHHALVLGLLEFFTVCMVYVCCLCWFDVCVQMVSIQYAVLVYMFIRMYVQYVRMYLCVYVHMCIQDITVRTLWFFPLGLPMAQSTLGKKTVPASLVHRWVGQLMCLHNPTTCPTHIHCTGSCLISTVCVCLCMLNDGQLAIHKYVHTYIHESNCTSGDVCIFVYGYLLE